MRNASSQELQHRLRVVPHFSILGDPGADSGGQRKSKRAEKYGTTEAAVGARLRVVPRFSSGIVERAKLERA